MEDGRVIHVESALTHHLFDVAIRWLVSAISSDAQKDDCRLEVSPFELGLMLIHENVSERIFDKLTSGL
jgi:hypothetical protein